MDDVRTAIEANWRARLEKKLRANSRKVLALKKMEDTGGMPDLTGIEGDEFIFDELALSLPRNRRELTYDQAVSIAHSMGEGVQLMRPERFELIIRELGVLVESNPDSTWLNSEKLAAQYMEAIRKLPADLVAIWGSRSERTPRIHSQRRDDRHTILYRAFRCSLRV